MVNVGDAVTIRVTSTDNNRVKSVQAEVYGTPVPLDNTGIGTFTLDKAGMFEVVAKAYDVSGNEGYARRELLVKNAGDTTPPEGSIKSPEDNSKISAPIDIIGTAYDENLAKYVLEYSEKGKNQYRKFAEGTSNVKDGILGKLDPTMMRNGQYDIRLSVYDGGGYLATYVVTYIIEGEQKVGNFSIGFEDLTVPVSGLPITVSRNYDSRNKTKGDFGIGWTMELQDIRIDESVVPGQYWGQQSTGGGFSTTYSLYEKQPHNITVTYPDGKTDEFTMSLSLSFQPFTRIQETKITFAAKPETYSKLEAIDLDNTVLVLGDGFYTDDLEYYNPNRYRLTTKEGMVFILNQEKGVESITDTNGNKVTYGRDGVIHSAGKSITFTRDSQERIAKITDPMGNSINYEYDYYGDLVKVTDQEGNITRFTYNSSHGLVDIIDPRGVKAARNEYDDEGRIIAHIDAEGNRTEYSRDVDARQEIVKDRLGNITVYEYDEKGNVLCTINPLGNKTTFTYDGNGKKLTETDALGNKFEYSYDAKGNLLKKTDSMGNSVDCTYNSEGKILTIKDLEGNIISNTYDDKGNLKKVTDPLGKSIEFGYNSKGLATSITDQLGRVVQVAYDSSGNVASTTYPDGNIVSFTYDNNGRCLSTTSTRTTTEGKVSVTTINTYDSLGNVIQTVDGNGNVSKAEYNEIGEVSAMIDRLGRRTEYDYDVFGNLARIKYPDGTEERFEYDKEGRNVAAVSPEGKRIEFSYDKLGRVIKEINSDGAYSSIDYDALGRVVKVTNEKGYSTEYKYDALGRNTQVKDALGNTTKYEYENSARPKKMVDAKGNATSFEYDGNGRQVKVIYHDNSYIEVKYDAVGNVISKIDQAGNTTLFDYDKAGNLVKITDALNNETSYAYDEIGNLLSIKDANGNVTTFEYDNLGRITKRTLPLGMSESVVYDAEGNIISKTDFDGSKIKYEYDVVGQLTVKTLPDNSKELYTYTKDGYISTVSDKRGKTVFEYDVANRLKSKADPDGKKVSYTYDAEGNIETVISGAGTVKYGYDEMSRLSTVEDQWGGIAKYEYDEVGNLVKETKPNGVIAKYGYDTLNRLIKLENIRSDGSILSSYIYTLGPSGNKLKVVENTGRTVNYEYDKLYRLIKETISQPDEEIRSISYTYDAVGNRLEKKDDGIVTEYKYDKNDRLLSEGERTYLYDNNGNLISKKDDDETTVYEYDYENRLVLSKTTTLKGIQRVEYTYDVFGNRVQKVVDEVNITNYVVDLNRVYARVLEERNADGGLIAAYVHSDIGVILQSRNGVKSYYHYDGHGSTRLLTDGAQSITDTYTYDAFGNITTSTGNTVNEFLFTGEQYDANIGFYYLRARYMDPSVGRFVTADPFGGFMFEPLSLHKYLYANADPVNNIDPSGYFSLGEVVTSMSIQNVLSSSALRCIGMSILKNAVKGLVTGMVFGGVDA
ncbi:MAG: RHS repeat protein, partial [Clostridiaceae bacterium]|nr:RHS repeat protein [Clostridiaceae bacterium]